MQGRYLFKTKQSEVKVWFLSQSQNIIHQTYQWMTEDLLAHSDDSV